MCTHAAASHVHYGNSHVINCGATWINYIHCEPLTAPLALCPLIHLCWHGFDTQNLWAASSSHCLKTNKSNVPHVIGSFSFFLYLDMYFLPQNSNSCDLALNWWRLATHHVVNKKNCSFNAKETAQQNLFLLFSGDKHCSSSSLK